MKKKLTLDRFEGNFGVCLDTDGKSYDIPKSALCGIEENDIFFAIFNGESISEIELLAEETKERKEKMISKLNKLFANSKKEDK